MGVERIWSSNKVITFIVDQYFAGLNTDNLQASTKQTQIVPTEKKPTAKRFVPPTPGEVWQHMWEKGCKTQSTADDFHNYYESNGWKVSRNPMKNWKAAASRWVKSDFNKPKLAAGDTQSMKDRLDDVSWAGQSDIS